MTADTTIYFGRPGSLVTVSQPRGGLQATRERPTSVFLTATGQARVGRAMGGARRYALNWETLDYDTFEALLGYDQGHEGPGPFALLDPGQRNMLTVNQSSATSHFNDTDNFTISGSGYTLSSSQAAYRRGPRSLRLDMAFSSQAGTLTVDPPADEWYGVPVKDGRSLVWHYYAKGAGADPVVTLTPNLVWYSAAGSVLSTSSGTATPTTSAALTQMSVAATPPASAAYVTPTVSVSGGTVTSGAVVYLDQLQLEEGSTPGTWRPGTGVKPVQVISLVDQWPWQHPTYRDGPVMVLQEVG